MFLDNIEKSGAPHGAPREEPLVEALNLLVGRHLGIAGILKNPFGKHIRYAIEAVSEQLAPINAKLASMGVEAMQPNNSLLKEALGYIIHGDFEERNRATAWIASQLIADPFRWGQEFLDANASALFLRLLTTMHCDPIVWYLYIYVLRESDADLARAIAIYFRDEILSPYLMRDTDYSVKSMCILLTNLVTAIVEGDPSPMPLPKLKPIGRLVREDDGRPTRCSVEPNHAPTKVDIPWPSISATACANSHYHQTAMREDLLRLPPDIPTLSDNPQSHPGRVLCYVQKTHARAYDSPSSKVFPGTPLMYVLSAPQIYTQDSVASLVPQGIRNHIIDLVNMYNSLVESPPADFGTWAIIDYLQWLHDHSMPNVAIKDEVERRGLQPLFGQLHHFKCMDVSIRPDFFQVGKFGDDRSDFKQTVAAIAVLLATILYSPNVASVADAVSYICTYDRLHAKMVKKPATPDTMFARAIISDDTILATDKQLSARGGGAIRDLLHSWKMDKKWDRIAELIGKFGLATRSCADHNFRNSIDDLMRILRVIVPSI